MLQLSLFRSSEGKCGYKGIRVHLLLNAPSQSIALTGTVFAATAKASVPKKSAVWKLVIARIPGKAAASTNIIRRDAR